MPARPLHGRGWWQPGARGVAGRAVQATLIRCRPVPGQGRAWLMVNLKPQVLTAESPALFCP